MFEALKSIDQDDCLVTSSRPFFKVLDQVIEVHNVMPLEKSAQTSPVVKDVIKEIWNVLALPKSFIDVKLLRKVFEYATDHADDRSTFFHSAKEKGTKAARIGRRLLKEEGASCVSEDATPLEKFMGSKLAIVLLRDLVDLPFYTPRPIQAFPLAGKVIEEMNKEFLRSPQCCLYVEDLDCSIMESTSSSTSYLRTKAEFEWHRPELFAVKSVDDHISNVSTVYFYGQHQSGFTGVTGNFYLTEDEGKRRQQEIMQKWEMNEKMNPNTKQFKWYDNYAGTADRTKAKLKLVVQDAPPNSVLATLAAIKKNLILFAYVCKALSKSQQCPQSTLYSKDATAEDLAEAILLYLDPEEARMYKNPLRFSTSSGNVYTKIEEYLTTPFFSKEDDYLVKQALPDEEKLGVMQSIPGRSFNHIVFVNALTKLQMTDSERELMSENKQDNRSLVLLPVYLSSYETNTPMFIAGISRRNKDMGIFPVMVGKASILYGKKDFIGTTSWERNFITLAEQVKELQDSSHVDFEEACDQLSISAAIRDIVFKNL